MTQPGWYSDPANFQVTRYWSGAAWTAQRTWNGATWIDGAVAAVRPAYAAPPPAYAAPPPAYAVPPQPYYGATMPPTTYVPGYPVAAGYGVPPRAAMSKKVSNRAILAIVGGAIAALGCLLPWATASVLGSDISVKGTSAAGGQFDLVLGLVVALLGGLFLAGRTGIKTNILSLVLAALLVVVCIANMVDISNFIDKQKSTTDEYGLGFSVHVGFGIVLVLIGGCIAFVALVLIIAGGRKRVA